jgi:hypothetical protein
MNTKELAKEAHNLATLAKNRSGNTVQDNDELLESVDEFLSKQRAKPDEIRNVATEVLNKKIQLEPEQITELAQKINDTIASLTNIDDILLETSEDLSLANNLKNEADLAK